MKKNDVLKTLNPQLQKIVSKLQRGHVYIIHDSKHNDEPILLTHFHKKGLRCKRLTMKTSKMSDWMGMPRTKLHRNLFTILYSRLVFCEIEEVPLERIPLYVGAGTEYLTDYIRDLKQEQIDATIH